MGNETGTGAEAKKVPEKTQQILLMDY